MKSIASHFSLVLTGMILIAMTVALATSRSDECGLIDCPRPQVARAAGIASPTPTLAPPQNLVFVHVESDKPDIQVSWSDN